MFGKAIIFSVYWKVVKLSKPTSCIASLYLLCIVFRQHYEYSAGKKMALCGYGLFAPSYGASHLMVDHVVEN